MNRSRQGQMEMIGLVILVILITVAFLFLSQFALNSKSDNRAFDRKQLAVSTLTAMLSTTVSGCSPEESEPLAVEQVLLEDCAENRGFDSKYQCKSENVGMHSCEFLQNILFPTLLKNSLDTFHQRYELTSVLVKDPDPPLVKVIGRGGCQARERDTSGEFFLNTNRGLVSSVLFVCD